MIVFPGNIQGRHIREPGPKGCLLVTVDDAQNVDRASPARSTSSAGTPAGSTPPAPRDGDDIARAASATGSATLLARPRRPAAGPPGRVPRRVPRRTRRVSADWTDWTNEIRQTATDAGSGRVWVEKVVLQDAAPRRRPADLDADGPLAELTAFLDELRGDDALLKELGDRELDDLRKKVPPDLLDGLDTPDRLRDLLDQVGPMLLSRLNGCRNGDRS